MSNFDIVVLGGVGIDTIVRVPALPLPDADSLQVPPVQDYVAHTGNGVALGCHSLGWRTKFIDFIGDDPQGRQILARYAERGLDFSYLIHPSGTRRSVNLVDPQGRRLSCYDGRHPPELRMPSEFYLPHLPGARHAHCSIMPWVLDVFEDARALGLSLSTDLHDWDGDDPYHRAFALGADVVFLSTAALGARRDAVMHAIVQQGRAQWVIAMAGGQGAYLLGRGESEVRHFPCVDLGRPIVDTNGAGDSFVAGFLHGHLLGLPVLLCVHLGMICGAYACSCHGTHEQFLDRATLQDYAKVLPAELFA